jgi:hypothetical protein
MKLFTRLDSWNQAYSLLEANITWLWAQAIEVSQAIDADRAATLAALTPHPPPHLLAEALVAARAIKSKGNRAKALAALAPRLPAHLLNEALAAARAIKSEGNRAKALAALAPRLPDDQPTVPATSSAPTRRVRTCSSLASGTSTPVPATSSAPTRRVRRFRLSVSSGADQPTVPDTLSAPYPLAAVPAPHPPPHLLNEALAAARAIKSEGNRAKALAALARYLPADQQSVFYAEALAAARAIEKEWHRAKALAALAPYLPYNLLAEAFDAAQGI